jgi:hypothetical protein
MLGKKKLQALAVASIISFSAGCATPANLSAVPVTQTSLAVNASSDDNAPVAPKIHIKIKKAEMEVSEEDLNIQFKSILELSDEKRIQNATLTILPNSRIRADGTIVQKLPLISNPLRLPFTVEGPLSIYGKNVIKFDAEKVKVANIPVKAFLDTFGLELANFTKFKDHFGRIELKGNSFLLIVEKFTDDAIIDGQMKSVVSGDKALTVIF